jgi:hypothetical protein
MPRRVTRLPCSWEKALSGEGISKIETIKYAHEVVGLRLEKGCAGGVQQTLKNTDTTSRQRERPTSLNL